jgi:metabolite-proton symporter
MQSAPANKPMSRIVATALAGASIEWYDFFIYGTAAATVFPALFFPQSDPWVGMLLSFATFAVGFVARPVGGAVFGHYGDRVGRKKALVVALLMMGLATTCIGLLPTYASIGLAAPAALVLLRFVQGLAIGGQWGGAALLLIESAPPGRRGFFGSFAQLGVPLGVILANLVFLGVTAAFGEEGVLEWAWRLPFLLSIALVGVGLYVQLRLEETPAFVEAQKVRPMQAAPAGSPILRVLREHPRTIALAAGAFVAINGNFYVLITYVVAYATKTLHMPQSDVLAAVMIGSLVQMPSLLIAAAISDRYGRRGIYMAGAALMGLWSLVFFPLVELKTLASVALAVGVGQALISLMYGPQAAFFGELFSTEVRYSGASLGYQIGSIFGGAFAPMIAAALLAATGSSMAIGGYMALLCAISFFSVRALRETRPAPA